MAKNKHKVPNPDDGFTVRMSKFSDIAGRVVHKEMRRQIWDLCEKVLTLPCIKGVTVHEEIIRGYRACIDAGDTNRLPYFSDGIGSKQNRLVSCIAAELSCLLVAFWEFDKRATGPAAERVTDHLEYLTNLVADPSTLRVEELTNCRYRAVNSRIYAGERLNEGVD